MPSLDDTAGAVARGLAAGWPDSDLVRLLAQAVEHFEGLPSDDARADFLHEPGLTGDLVWDAAFAGLAVHLCRLAHMERSPNWTREPQRYSPRITWIGLPPGSTMQAYVYQRTPAYFKARGVMLNEANLVSV
jgi:hypothetical protein